MGKKRPSASRSKSASGKVKSPPRKRAGPKTGTKAGTKAAAKTAKTPKEASKKTADDVVATARQVADALGVSVDAVGKWRAKGMPGSPGSYPLAEIIQWRDDTIRPTAKSHQDQEKDYGNANVAKAKFLIARADKERAQANMAQREDELQEGSYTSIDDLNLFLGEFFTEFRQLLNRTVVEFAAGYSKALKAQIREDLQSRIDLALRQMHDWTLKTEDLEIDTKPKGARK